MEVISGVCSDVQQIIPVDPIVYGDDNFNFLANEIFNAKDEGEIVAILEEFLSSKRDILNPATAGQIEVHNTFIDRECENETSK